MKTKSAPFTGILAALAASLLLTPISRAADPDVSTPKKAAVSFAKAVESGDIATAKKVATGTDAEWAMVKMLSDTVVAMKALSAAATDKFGDKGKLPEGMSMELSSEFDSSDEKIDGDSATLISKTKPNDPFPPQLKKTAAGWNLDLTNMSKDPSTPQMMQMMPVMIKAFTTVAADIKAGKYQTMDEAMEAFGKLMIPPPSADAAGAPPAPDAPK